MGQSQHLTVSIKDGSPVSPQIGDFLTSVVECFRATRDISVQIEDATSQSNGDTTLDPSSILQVITQLSSAFRHFGRPSEAEALHNAFLKCSDPKEYGGLGYADKPSFSDEECLEVLFQVQAWMEAINSQESARHIPKPLERRSSRTRPMTLAQKIFAHHAIDGCATEGLNSQDLTRVSVDWIMASELSYKGMQKTMEKVGQPGIFRNDRFWLAGDHVYDPRIKDLPRVQALFQAAEKAKKDYKMTEYQGMNYTIMHTEFVRERAQPGMIVIGSDSHTCSAGAVGCLAIGLGAIDVTMALITGETWFKVPESILISFTGKPLFSISGKDVILHILKTLKRNTVAAERIVEFSGPGLKHLSVDARFAISNMCTEFGAVTGIFTPDEVTQDYISRRRRKANKSDSTYFKPDSDAQYAGVFEIDLAKVEPTIALYPNPDDVVPISEKAGMPLHGVFIGACTTTEEDLVLAALVLKAGLSQGLPLARGTRHVVPGSLPIVEKLRKLNLLGVYEAAGFTRGPPGCSYCVGMAADQAGDGEVWLSSQNRNFKNRMGKGSIGNITSAVVVAASSFSMTLNDPAPLLAQIDKSVFEAFKNGGRLNVEQVVKYVEPNVGRTLSKSGERETMREGLPLQPSLPLKIRSRVINLGDFIDTDALAPAQILATAKDDAEFGDHCLEHTHPEFRQAVRNGQQIVVGGNAFGVGSSREEAVRALKGLGVQAVIAKSFAFIYGRNQPSLGLLGIIMEDEDFYATAVDSETVTIDIATRTITVGLGESSREFPFMMAEMEYRLTVEQGISEAYNKYKNEIWKHLTEERGSETKPDGFAMVEGLMDDPSGADRRLQW